MTLPILKMTVYGVLTATLSLNLLGCSSDKNLSESSQSITNQAVNLLKGHSPSSVNNDDAIKAILSEQAGSNKASSAMEDGNLSSDLEALKAQLEQQQQRLQLMNEEQQALQEMLKRQSITLKIMPTANANAGRAKQGTASTAYVAFLEDQSQFTEIETLAVKEISVIPNRQSSTKLTIPAEAKFIAIKVGLRYTKKRSQLLIPISSINFEQDLALNIGACDVNITAGIDAELTADFTTKLKYYQQPLVRCS